ncbi:hypothetical protein LX64_02174 [Chitinophaga skermanii]|uniref:Uncharacterized protein n=1 Tax=Chitinophaga skermanii TaxID=331697 RepID=A0A327QL53_9BACT|nr:hypothetical protein [Chitinophaga skermanii]RAJ05020.1 hypothetical protein LX64_02174 [Chitinophaga skermanii]
MKLPAILKNVGSYNGISAVQRNANRGNTHGISLQSDIEACVRTGNLDGNPVDHCYIRLIGNNGSIEDSISFGPDETGNPDKRPNRPNACHLVRKNISPASWQKIKSYYREHCGTKEFEFRKHDCCTCTASALNTIGERAPAFVTKANPTT